MARDVWGKDEEGGRSMEAQLLEKILMAGLTEQRRARRWKIFFRMVYILLFLSFLVTMNRESVDLPGSTRDHTGVVDVQGEIGAQKEASAENIIKGLDDAFANEHCKAVVLRINSPGGSPVQADRVYREIMRLRHLHPKRPIYAVIGDIGASGAYYMASAANDIYVNPASIVGSIGVIMEGFGFPDVLRKLGIDRRLETAGAHKAIGDPFSPVSAFDQNYVQNLLNEVHQQFIDAVVQGRGNRLHPTNDMFSGLFWTGTDAIRLGLADGLGSPEDVAREKVHAPTLINYTHSNNPWDAAAHKIGLSAADSLVTALRTSLGSAPDLR